MVSFYILSFGGDFVMELEEALKRIVDLEQKQNEMNDYCESLKVENESFKTTISTQEEKINKLKQINMRYFERLTMETNQVDTSNSSDSISKEEPKDWESFLNEW